MTVGGIDATQRTAAKVVGFCYLFAMVTAVFSEFYVRAHLINFDDAVETARNIVAHEGLFRLGIASDLLAFATDIVLIGALYIVLKPVNRSLALVAALWRMVETTILVVMTLTSFDVLRVLSGADYLRGFEVDRLQALARLSIGAHSAGYTVGLMFFGLGSTVFGYLWFKSNYIPRALAAWGVFSSLLVFVCTFSFIIFPNLMRILSPACYGPIFVFELTMGFWLLLKELRPKAELDEESGRAIGGGA